MLERMEPWEERANIRPRCVSAPCGWCSSRAKHTGRSGRPGLTTSERERLKELERENRELKRANEILRKASAFFAHAELDRQPK